MLEDKTIFITGAMGFIGKRLLRMLLPRNRIIALIKPGSKNKAIELQKDNTEIIYEDLLNKKKYCNILNNIDYVFHLAALFKVDAPQKELYQQNVLGTQRLLEACINKNIQKIVYFSTAYVSGRKEKELITEEEPYPLKFKNWYEWSKAEAEKVVKDFSIKYKLPIIILRPAIVYGPGSFYGFYNALKLISQRKLFILPGNGKNRIHLVHVDDVVNAAIHLAEKSNNIGEIYNICDNSRYSCKELISMLCSKTKVKKPFLHIPRSLLKYLVKTPVLKIFFYDINSQMIDYFIYDQSFDNNKLKDSGYSLNYSLTELGLNSTIDWYRKNNFI